MSAIVVAKMESSNYFDFQLICLIQLTLQLFNKVVLVPCLAGMVKREEGANPSLTRNCNRR